MAFKDILVIIDQAPSMAARLEVALQLAADHDAHLTGLYVRTPLALPSFIESTLTADVRTALEAEEEARMVRAGARFTDGLRRAGRLERSEWRVAVGAGAEVCAVHGRYCDLLVAGQPDPAATLVPPSLEPDALVFACGRPVLVIPYAGRFPTIGRRVLVGWNGSREAARALADAMPILERARMVTLLSVNTDPGIMGGDGEPGIEIARHLSHHGIMAEASHFISEPHEVGDTLLNYATDLSSDLIVMGAYGQSRLRSVVLGSLTGFMLRHMTVPVLFAH